MDFKHNFKNITFCWRDLPDLTFVTIFFFEGFHFGLVLGLRGLRTKGLGTGGDHFDKTGPPYDSLTDPTINFPVNPATY